MEHKADEAGARPAPPQKLPRRRALSVVSFAMLVVLAGAYSLRPGIATAITVWPAWVGLLFGVGLTLLMPRPRRWLMLGWVLFGVGFVEEFRTLPRGLFPAPPADFRVVTLNCAGGSALAAAEVMALRPDVVLFQESPSRPDLERLAREIYGPNAVVAWGPDTSILARGRLEPFPRPRRIANYVAARWHASPERTLDLVSLRLAPPVLRFDLYNPAAWQDFAESRARRGQEMADMHGHLMEQGVQPGILGGDFNTPVDPPIQEVLVGEMEDAFAAAGVGLGATCVNPAPNIVRIDQIWFGPSVSCVRAWVVPTRHSDHRMVVADFRWR